VSTGANAAPVVRRRETASVRKLFVILPMMDGWMEGWGLFLLAFKSYVMCGIFC